ncbi:MAG: J domain-containing protein, partial [bacterium]
MIDYYNLLGVNPSARPEEIRAAFRRLAKRAHPDAQPNLAGEEKEASHRRFIRLAQAYETLSDPGRRGDYDRKLRAARMRSPSRPGRAAEAGAKAGGRPKAGTARQHGSGRPGPRPAQPRPAQPTPDRERALSDKRVGDSPRLARHCFGQVGDALQPNEAAPGRVRRRLQRGQALVHFRLGRKHRQRDAGRLHLRRERGPVELV